MKITKNLLMFAGAFAVFAILFRAGLSWSLTNHRFTEMWIIAVLYFMANFSIGWFFGKRDYLSLPLYDIGFRFHLATYVIFNLISELWFLLGLNSAYEQIRTFRYILIFWGVGIIIHFTLYLLSRKNAISGIDKSKIFE